MACHELAALRLGLMETLGIDDEAEKQHELAELGDAVNEAGPIQSLCRARTLDELQQFYQSALANLEEKVAACSADDPKLGYYRALLVLNKKVEQDLRRHLQNLNALYNDLEEVHDFLHEIYPAE